MSDRVKPFRQAPSILEAVAFAGFAHVAPALTRFDTPIQEAPAVSHPRLRFTVRRLMFVVLIVAALLAAFEAGRRWERAERAASDYAVFDPLEMESR